MSTYPTFLSLVIVTRNQSAQLTGMLESTVRQLCGMVADFEIIVVDNASTDDSIGKLKELTGVQGLPNLQIYALTKEIDQDTASWVGLENALGDHVVVIDPFLEDINFLPKMLDEAFHGADVVFTKNTEKPGASWAYRASRATFNQIYTRLGGVDLTRDAPHFRLLSKRVVNFILQHSQPSVTYRHLPATGGFARCNLTYSHPPQHTPNKDLWESIDMGMRLLVSTTQAPMRLVTSLSMFGAIANLMYSAYVVAIGLFKTDVAPGWVSLSLQQSGMFFLLSLVLLVLGEYILHMRDLTTDGPLYHVGQEFTSARVTRREKLNIEESRPVHATHHAQQLERSS